MAARRGYTLHMPIAISVSDLRDIISECLRTKFPEEEPSLLSVEWIRFSLLHAIHTAPILCDIFEVKFAVQIRQLRKSHQIRYILSQLGHAYSCTHMSLSKLD